MNETKICLLGGDTRQITLARHLAECGYETAVWGLVLPEGGESPAFVRCADAESAVRGSRAVILPLPATADGVRVNCRQADGALPLARCELRLTRLMEMMPPGCLLLAGMPGDLLRAMAREANITLIDYYDCESVQIRNAVPTAEGAVALAMNALPVTIFGSDCTVLGYGRIGRRLASILHALGAHVTVAARSDRDLCQAEISGCTARPLSEFLAMPGQPDVLFNTIPAPVLTRDAMERLPASSIYIELASAPGGIEASAVKLCRQTILHASSLPGKVAPVTAGRILFASVRRILASEGVNAP